LSSAEANGLRLPKNLSATLALVRHGESTYVAEGRFQGRRDPPLSQLGERQAALVAARLADRGEGTPLPLPVGPPIGIWHSPLRRAAQTAATIAHAQPAGLELNVNPDLTELAQGEWEGKLMADVRARWPAELRAWRQNPAKAHAPGGESLTAAGARAAEALNGAAAALAQSGGLAYRESDPVPGYPSSAAVDAVAEPWAILVAHDGIFRLALLALLAMPLDRFWSLPFNLCGVTVVSLYEGAATLRAHNLSEHLAPLALEARAAAEARGERRGAL